MGAELSVGVAEKTSGDRIRLSMDFGDEPLLIDGAEVVSYDVPAVSGLTVTSIQQDYPFQISALVFGGTSGEDYNVVFEITLNDPDQTVISRTGVLKVI